VNESSDTAGHKSIRCRRVNFRRRADTDWMDAFFDFPILGIDVHLIRER
jgi:hypothetical protein